MSVLYISPQHPSTVIRQRWVTSDEFVTVVADSHHLVNVGESISDAALFVVDLLALARAGPGRIDFATTSRAVIYCFSYLIVRLSTGRTLAAYRRDSGASQRHCLEDPGLLPSFHSSGFSDGVPRTD